jgi:hypothetical protein
MVRHPIPAWPPEPGPEETGIVHRLHESSAALAASSGDAGRMVPAQTPAHAASVGEWLARRTLACEGRTVVFAAAFSAAISPSLAELSSFSNYNLDLIEKPRYSPRAQPYSSQISFETLAKTRKSRRRSTALAHRMVWVRQYITASSPQSCISQPLPNPKVDSQSGGWPVLRSRRTTKRLR